MFEEKKELDFNKVEEMPQKQEMDFNSPDQAPKGVEKDFNLSSQPKPINKPVNKEPDYQGVINKLNQEHNLTADKGFKLSKTDDPAYKGVNILHPTGRGMTPNELEYATQKGTLKGYQELADSREKAMRNGTFKNDFKTEIKEDKTGDYYKIKSPKITETDAFLTAPVVKSLEKAEGRSLGNDELRSIVKSIADKNPDASPKEFEKMLLDYKKEQPEVDDLSDEELKEELVDNKYYYENARNEEEIAKWLAERQDIPYDRALAFVKANYKGGAIWNDKYEKKTDLKSNEEIDWDLAEKNEKINGSKGKSETRKDKYGNPLLSDEAFKVGVEAGKAYLEESLKYDSLESLKRSNVFLGYLEDYINNAIVNNGYNPNLDSTYQDINEIIGVITGEEVDMERYGVDATKGFTGKKYSGYNPLNLDSKDEIVYPKGTSKEYTDKVNAEYKKALPILEAAGIKLEDFGGRTNDRGGYEDNSKEIMDKYVFEPFRQKYPNGNNDAWEKEYKPLFEALDAVFDKNYNDWWIRNK